MEPNFELFEEGEVKRGQVRVHVTLRRNGKIFFNRHALAAIGDPAAVALLFDARLQIIGVMPTALNQKHAYRLRTKDQSSGRIITARNFCTRYAIKPTDTLEFPTARVNRDGTMMLDLHAAEPVKRRECRTANAISDE
jgi:hypothetical protein